MARYRRGKMALYEVMSKAKVKPGYGQTLEKMRTDKAGEEEAHTEKEEAVVAETAAGTETAVVTDESAAVNESGVVETPGVSVQWRWKPRIVQYNGGRIEFSVPYQIGIAIVLGLVVVMLLAFRAGQRSGVVEKAGASNPPLSAQPNPEKAVAGGNERIRKDATSLKETTGATGDVGAAASTGSNVIVLVEHRVERDLVPVRAHFASYGIATEIVLSRGQYFLLTKDRYTGFAAGGKGDLAKQKIVEVGKKYKAPQGHETFAKHLFSDAYGKNVDQF